MKSGYIYFNVVDDVDVIGQIAALTMSSNKTTNTEKKKKKER